MQIRYYPKVDANWNQIPGQTVGMSIVYPDSYDPTKRYPFAIAVHGIGERGAGNLAMLENLVLGFDYNGDGIREGEPFLTWEMQKAVDKYGIIFAVPNYANFFEPDLVNWTYNFARSLFSLTEEMMFVGFSLGGGSIVKFCTSSLANANRVAYAVPCAPTSNIVDASIVGKSNLPIHFFVNTNDTNAPTNINVTKSIVNAINSSNPAIKAIYTAFNKTGHGGYNEAVTIAPPKAPNGQGFINSGENIYEVFLDILKSGPRQMREEGQIPVPPNPEPIPIITANAGADQTVVEPSAYLDGTRSTGYKSARWQVVQVPNGVSMYDPIVQSGGWITTRLVFTREGTYAFKLVVYSNGDYTGTTAEDTVVVTYNTSAFPPPKVLLEKVYIPKNDNFVYVYDDGSTETKAT